MVAHTALDRPFAALRREVGNADVPAVAAPASCLAPSESRKRHRRQGRCRSGWTASPSLGVVGNPLPQEGDFFFLRGDDLFGELA